MFVVDKKHVVEIDNKIPYDIRRDFTVKTKTNNFILPLNMTVTKADRYISDGIGYELLELEIYLVHGDDEYVSLVADKDMRISLLKYNPEQEANTLDELLGGIADNYVKVDLLYDDSNHLTINKVALVFTLLPENVPETVTFFIKNSLKKDIKSGNIKTTQWVEQFLE